MSDKKIRIGILGMANIAKRSVIPAILQLDHLYQVEAIATRRISNSQGFITSDIQLIEGYDNILTKNIIDAVYIPLPNSLHYEWVKKSLEKGLHVLVEKSLGCSYNEVIELTELAKEKKLALVENFQFRFHSQLEYIQSILKDKLLGELRFVRSAFCFPPFPDKDNIRYKKELGGGALLDAGAYPTKISQIILGVDLEVTSATLNYSDDFNVDIWGGAYLKQKNGNLFSQIAFGFDNYYQCNIEIVGSKGRLYTNRIFTANESIKPIIILETQENGSREIELNPDNHFKKILLHFHELMTGSKDKEQEYNDNIIQARLLQEIKNKS